MVKICSLNYPKQPDERYGKYFGNYKYELHDFQKWCVEGIVEGHHVLACCPTGSGKTFGGEFAIDFFHSKGQKIIYCSPIKALSNQKFHDFTQKYPHLTIGLITGDIKCNPDAQVLIMTTEILLNKLYQLKSNNPVPKSAISFDMDIERELGCVVFDEIHMINDASRGHVWEQSILLLPRYIQIVGLSATLDDPEKFAYWLENKGEQPTGNTKLVYLTTKKDRSVPLTHYNFLTTTSSVFKIIKDKALQEEINSVTGKPMVIQSASGVFNDVQYNKMNKVLNLFGTNNIRINRQHVLNKVSEYLVQNEMLPALCYVFSRKQLEKCATEITTNLLEFDSKVPYIIDRECEQIIRKLPNYEEYLHLPEYVNMVQLLRKGVATHHAGLMPVLREMVELLFARGFVKILFCTETMSVGINLPVKTTIFTDINKFDGTSSRMLYGHEYTQAAGRAGRLGLDTVGHVIHLNNLFRDVESVGYKTMLKGRPQTMVSKFKISYNLLLNLIDGGDDNFIGFSKKSMITNEIDSQLGEILSNINNLNSEIGKLQLCLTGNRTPEYIVEEYLDLLSKKQGTANKKRKDIDKQIRSILNEYPCLDNDKSGITKLIEKRRAVNDMESHFNQVEFHIDNNVKSIVTLLKNDGFVVDDPPELTDLGKIAMHLREVHCLVFAKLITAKTFDSLTSFQMVSLFSCFTNVTVSDDLKDSVPKSKDVVMQSLINRITDMYNDYQAKEVFSTGMEYNIHYDLINYVIDWCHCENAVDCKVLLQRIVAEKQIFLGEFVKALLKINNISCEMEKIAELTGDMSLLSKLKQIPDMTLKYVVTNQSLYV